MRPFSAALIVVLSAFPGQAAEIDPARAKADPKANILWYNIDLLELEGKGWAKTKAPYDRLPAKAEGVVRDPVWNLGRRSAGMAVRFVTDATSIQARWTLTSLRLAMPHMPATGVSGLDLYVKDEGRWRWIGAGRPADGSVKQQTTLARGLPPGKREFLLYLPLYNGVSSVEIGIAKDAKLARSELRPADTRKPLVFYGTSITQGGCASRPGMVHTAILGRRLERPVINLGFSGNGRMEPEMASLLAELDPAVFVIECLPNMNAKEVRERAGALVKTIRKARPTTPILLVEGPTYSQAFLVADVKRRTLDCRAALKSVFDELRSQGVKNLHYLQGDKQYGDDGEAAVDGVHATDLGFLRLADAYEPTLTKILKP